MWAMNALELAQHGFREIAPLLSGPITTEVSDRAEGWIHEEVLPVVEGLCLDLRFRAHASWSLEHLLPGSNSPERRLVEAASDAIVEAASATSAMAGCVDVTFPGGGPPSPENLAVVDWIAGKPWRDLAFIQDVFLPPSHLNCRSESNEWHAEFGDRVADARVLGDNVYRGLIARIDCYRDRIDRVGRWCWLKQVAGWRAEDGPLLRMINADAAVVDAVSALRAAYDAGKESGLRDAAAALVQVCAAYAATPELQWLGCDSHTASVFGRMLKTYVRPAVRVAKAASPCDSILVPLVRPDVLRTIATALDAVGPLFSRPVETEDLILVLRSQRQLLLVDCTPRSVYWNGEPIDFAWDGSPALWDFLWKLGSRAKLRQHVEPEDILRRPASRALKDRRHRLANAVPPSLDERIVPFDTGGYRLDVEPGQIELLSLDSYERPIEVGIDVIPVLPPSVASVGSRAADDQVRCRSDVRPART